MGTTKQQRGALYMPGSTAAQNMDGQEAELTQLRWRIGVDRSENLSGVIPAL